MENRRDRPVVLRTPDIWLRPWHAIVPKMKRDHEDSVKKMKPGRITKLGIVPFLSLGILTLAMAKRKAPPELNPVEFGESVFTPSTQQCGIVVQTNRKSGEVVRKIRFYRVVYRPLLERDVQDVWFTDFFRQGDDIWARDEKGRIYKMLLKTMKPQRNAHTTAAQFEDLKKAANP